METQNIFTPRVQRETGPYQYSHRVNSASGNSVHYAPHLHICAYHERVRIVRVMPYINEILELTIPNKFTLTDTVSFVKANELEFLQMMNELIDSQYDVTPKRLTYRSTIPFLGKKLPIHAIPAGAITKVHIDEDGVWLPEGLQSEEIREAVLNLLGEIAYELLRDKIDYYADVLDVMYYDLAIDDGRRTFGSYNIETGMVFLSRRLLLMSEDIVNYLVVHELAHIKVFAHDKAHDAVMASVLPNYKRLDTAFSKSCGRLIEQGWL